MQGNSLLASCSEITIITISFPMTRTAFKAIQDKYIESVATTAGVIRENVKILSVDEVSNQSSRVITGRLLLATSIHVQTSVLFPMGKKVHFSDQVVQSVLNSNLNKNGLPSGVVQSNTTTGGSTTPRPLVSAASESTPSNVPQLCMILCIICFHLSCASL
jgi:hypothetical protein